MHKCHVFLTVVEKNYFLNRARDNIFFNALVSADKDYTPLNLSDNIISDIVEANIPDTIANIKQKSLRGRYFKELEQIHFVMQDFLLLFFWWALWGLCKHRF
jgi:hypothetical protein